MKTLHHVERVEVMVFDLESDYKELTDLGEQIFEFNTRTHGDTEDIFNKVFGRFFYQHGSLHFRSNNALGSSEMVATNDLHTRVVAYYRFLD